MSLPVVYPNAALGDGATLDAGVQVGYPTGRAIAERALVVGPGAMLRTGTVIYEGSRIGGGLQTGHNVVIREENVLGAGVQVWSNSVIDYGCVIGDRVKIHSNCYIAQFTTIGDDCFLAPGVTVANDIHPGCAFSQPCMQGPTLEAGVQVGVNATLLPFIRIGAGAIIAAGAVVTANVPAGSVVAGNPARVVRQREELVCSTGLTDRPYPAHTAHAVEKATVVMATDQGSKGEPPTAVEPADGGGGLRANARGDGARAEFAALHPDGVAQTESVDPREILDRSPAARFNDEPAQREVSAGSGLPISVRAAPPFGGSSLADDPEDADALPTR